MHMVFSFKTNVLTKFSFTPLTLITGGDSCPFPGSGVMLLNHE